MSCANTNKKTSTTSGFNLNSISGVLNIILTAFAIPDKPVAPLPPPLILIGSKLRPGMSSSAIKSRIIARQSEAGLPVGNVFADGPNTHEAMISIITDEFVNSIQTEAVVNVVLPPGISVSTVGVAAGVPVVSQGATTGMAVGNGIIR
jgi:hypothetical protein